MGKGTSPFDIVNDVITNKVGIIDADNQESVTPWLINQQMGYHRNLVSLANEANVSRLEGVMLYDFYFHAIPKHRPPFRKWIKVEVPDKIELIMEYYDYSEERAKEVYHLFSDIDFKSMKKELESLK